MPVCFSDEEKLSSSEKYLAVECEDASNVSSCLKSGSDTPALTLSQPCALLRGVQNPHGVFTDAPLQSEDKPQPTETYNVVRCSNLKKSDVFMF